MWNRETVTGYGNPLRMILLTMLPPELTVYQQQQRRNIRIPSLTGGRSAVAILQRGMTSHRRCVCLAAPGEGSAAQPSPCRLWRSTWLPVGGFQNKRHARKCVYKIKYTELHLHCTAVERVLLREWNTTISVMGDDAYVTWRVSIRVTDCVKRLLLFFWESIRINKGCACVLYNRAYKFFVRSLCDWNDEARSSVCALIYLLESHCVQALLVLWTKIKRIEKEIFVLSCHYRLHYRRFRSAVYHMTELTVKNIYSYLII